MGMTSVTTLLNLHDGVYYGQQYKIAHGKSHYTFTPIIYHNHFKQPSQVYT